MFVYVKYPREFVAHSRLRELWMNEVWIHFRHWSIVRVCVWFSRAFYMFDFRVYFWNCLPFLLFFDYLAKRVISQNSVCFSTTSSSLSRCRRLAVLVYLVPCLWPLISSDPRLTVLVFRSSSSGPRLPISVLLFSVLAKRCIFLFVCDRYISYRNN